MQYAGFWRRFGAYWIDAIVMLPLWGLYYFAGEQTRLFYLYWLVPGLLIGLWFHVFLVKKYGGTPGKLMIGIKIAMIDGRPVTVVAAAARYSVLFVFSLLSSVALSISVISMSDDLYFSLGYFERSRKLIEMAPPWFGPVNIITQIWVWSEFVTMLFNKKRRAIHDFIAGTVVIRAEEHSVAEEIDPASIGKCVHCGAQYNPRHYNIEAPVWLCSECKSVLPREERC